MLIDEKITTILANESSNFNRYADLLQAEIDLKGYSSTRNFITTDMLYYLLNLDMYPNINLELYKRLNQLTELFSNKLLVTTIPEVAEVTTPSITSETLGLEFGYVLIGEYTDRYFSFTASNLANIVSIIPSSKYTISLDQYHNFSTSIGIVPSSEGTINSTTIYVRYTPTTVSTDIGNIVVSSGSATISVTVIGTGIEGT